MKIRICPKGRNKPLCQSRGCWSGRANACTPRTRLVSMQLKINLFLARTNSSCGWKDFNARPLERNTIQIEHGGVKRNIGLQHTLSRAARMCSLPSRRLPPHDLHQLLEIIFLRDQHVLLLRKVTGIVARNLTVEIKL